MSKAKRRRARARRAALMQTAAGRAILAEHDGKQNSVEQPQQRARKKNIVLPKGTVIIPGDGGPCTRCGQPTQIRAHAVITDKMRRQPFFYSRWPYCVNLSCPTKGIMLPQFMVWNTSARASHMRRNGWSPPERSPKPPVPPDMTVEERNRLRAVKEQLHEADLPTWSRPKSFPEHLDPNDPFDQLPGVNVDMPPPGE
jgi:hypothetical protein